MKITLSKALLDSIPLKVQKLLLQMKFEKTENQPQPPHDVPREWFRFKPNSKP